MEIDQNAVLRVEGYGDLRAFRPEFYLIDGGDGAASISKRKHKPPTCPAHLSPTAKTEWKRAVSALHLRGIIGGNDRAALAAYRQSFDRRVEAGRKPTETPLLNKLLSGDIQQSPLPAIANKQLEIMHRYLAELDFSPVSRSRVTKLRSHEQRLWEGGAPRPVRRLRPRSPVSDPRPGSAPLSNRRGDLATVPH